jgi:radical SAM protein with 4Fe4S-binding SPASM domain
MANIAITSYCNLNCPYCFTQDTYHHSGIYGHMPANVFKQSLDLILRSGLNEISILGGEPTLHPGFIDFMEIALKTGLKIRLFTNGHFSQRILEYLSELPVKKVRIILNVNFISKHKHEVPSVIDKAFSQLNNRIIPGFNIYEKDLSLLPLLDLIKHYNLKKNVRLGLAQPCLDAGNQYLPVKHYSLTGRKILDFAKKAKEQGVKIILDCGFVPCMFGPVDLSEYGLDPEAGLHCDPIPDILPDGSMVPCYPLSHLNKNQVNDGLTLNDIRRNMQEVHLQMTSMGIFKICSFCQYRQKGYCKGGCTSHKILRLNAINL